MPGTIGTYRDDVGNEVKATVTHCGAVFVLVDNDGSDPFGGRYVTQAPAPDSALSETAAHSGETAPGRGADAHAKSVTVTPTDASNRKFFMRQISIEPLLAGYGQNGCQPRSSPLPQFRPKK